MIQIASIVVVYESERENLLSIDINPEKNEPVLFSFHTFHTRTITIKKMLMTGLI